MWLSLDSLVLMLVLCYVSLSAVVIIVVVCLKFSSIKLRYLNLHTLVQNYFDHNS